MKYTLMGRNIEVSDTIKEAIESKLDRLSKYFTPETEARATVGTDGDLQKIEVTIPTKLGFIRAEDAGYDLYSSIDNVAEIIEKQIKKYKNKLIDKKQSAIAFSQNFIDEDYPEEDEDGLKIVKTKSFALKPMDAEEACLQMEMLGHNFFVFLNMDTNQVNVVYKRKGNSYGLIEPEI
ncbi:MAG: ribosome-associated translation inhibitor RaiA [Lachnospiraceae bacterium]|nr:ribosome-associated translation inhibitor RaiA [Lachnospiraceae bacterium]